VDDVDARLERAIGALLDDRRAGATICPSEAARAVDPQGWRELMPAARAAAGRLAAAGRVEVTQRGEVVDVATVRGPVRVRRRQGGPPAGGSSLGGP
jgi:Mg-chelatase subunit ChlI